MYKFLNGIWRSWGLLGRIKEEHFQISNSHVFDPLPVCLYVVISYRCDLIMLLKLPCEDVIDLFGTHIESVFLQYIAILRCEVPAFRDILLMTEIAAGATALVNV